ncbi:MAG: maltotransferase domain-containing protein [Flavobacteriales bacterium]
MKKQAKAISKPFDKIGQQRVIIENVTPIVEGGFYPAKRVEDEWVIVEADVFTDGHDMVRGVVTYRAKGARKWNDIFMKALGNDRFQAYFHLPKAGEYEFTVRGYIDHVATWQHAFRKRLQESDERELLVQVQIALDYIQRIATKYAKAKNTFKKWIELLQSKRCLSTCCKCGTRRILRSALLRSSQHFDKTLEIMAHRKRAGSLVLGTHFFREVQHQKMQNMALSKIAKLYYLASKKWDSMSFTSLPFTRLDMYLEKEKTIV